MLNDSVASGDGGSGVPSLFDSDANGDFMQEGDERSFTGSSKGSKSGSRTSDYDSQSISSIANDLKQLHKRSIALQKFEEEQNEKDRSHATMERLCRDV